MYFDKKREFSIVLPGHFHTPGMFWGIAAAHHRHRESKSKFAFEPFLGHLQLIGSSCFQSISKVFPAVSETRAWKALWQSRDSTVGSLIHQNILDAGTNENEISKIAKSSNLLLHRRFSYLGGWLLTWYSRLSWISLHFQTKRHEKIL